MTTVDTSALPAPPLPDTGAPLLAEWTHGVRPSAIAAMMGAMARPGVISFALGLPAPELFPTDEWAAAAARVLASDRGALQYRAPSPRLKAQVAELLAARGVRCRPEQVFLTSGAQQALALLARLFLEPGGAVVCERSVYMGFRQVVEPYRPALLEVDSDLATGMDVDAVEALLEEGARPAFVYCIPDGHNPLGVSLSPEKRRRLAALARRHRVPVVEDDAYGLLHYEPPLPPLAALEERWVWSVGSFSKVMAPGFRVGWLVVPEALVERAAALLVSAKDGLDIDTSTFAQHLVSAYLETGRFAAHLEGVRAAYGARRDAMTAALARHFPAGTRWSFPRHGALMWVELPGGLDAGALLPEALETAGVAYVPGSVFAAGGSRAGAGALRLNFSFPTLPQIEEGIARLGRVFQGALA